MGSTEEALFQLNSSTTLIISNVSTLVPQGYSSNSEGGMPQDLNLAVITSTNMSPTMWYVVHITAVVSLAISIMASLGVIIYLLATGNEKSFWRRRISERLVIYIALSDLFYSTEHLIDHVYMLSKLEWPPDIMCAILGFFLQEFATSQSLIVLFTALNAFVLIVKEKGIPTGKYDWALLLVSFGAPAVIGTVCGILGYLGPSEVWCLLDIRKPNANIVNHIYSSVFLVVFIADIVFYALVIHKIQKSSKMVQQFDASASNPNAQKKKNLSARAAKVMSVFVVAFILQWWSYIVYSAWVIFETPYAEFLVVVVFFSNIGGVFNCLAYTVVRRIYTSTPASKRGTTKKYSSVYNIDGRQRLKPKLNHEKKLESEKNGVTNKGMDCSPEDAPVNGHASRQANGHANRHTDSDSQTKTEANHI